MRTCPKCGCYIPDNWTTCPACYNSEKKESKVSSNGFYRVTIFFDPYGIDETIFWQKEKAFSYAQYKASLRFIKTAEVWDCQTKECLKIFC